MDIIKKTVVVIPAYEPSETILDIAGEITDAGFRLIVVNDGSEETEKAIWEHLRSTRRVRVIEHEYNQGKGAALKTAFRYIKNYIPDVGCIVTMDADGQHLVEDMKQIMQFAWNSPGELVLGSRKLGRDIPIKSYLGNTITRKVFRLVSGCKVHDTQTGL